MVAREPQPLPTSLKRRLPLCACRLILQTRVGQSPAAYCLWNVERVCLPYQSQSNRAQAKTVSTPSEPSCPSCCKNEV